MFWRGFEKRAMDMRTLAKAIDNRIAKHVDPRGNTARKFFEQFASHPTLKQKFLDNSREGKDFFLNIAKKTKDRFPK